MRISRPQMFLEIAQVVAKRATCFRLNIGAVVVHDRRCVSIGYNGPPAGEPHCYGSRCPLSASGGCSRSVHAEINAIERIPKELIAGPLELYTTHSPCENCAQAILMHPGITTVYFSETYRNSQHLEWFNGKKKVYRILPSGTTIDHFTNEIVELEDSKGPPSPPPNLPGPIVSRLPRHRNDWFVPLGFGSEDRIHRNSHQNNPVGHPMSAGSFSRGIASVLDWLKY